MDCPPEICQGMTQPHEDLLFDPCLLLLYPPTLLKTITEKFLVLVVVVYYLDTVNSKKTAAALKTEGQEFQKPGVWIFSC